MRTSNVTKLPSLRRSGDLRLLRRSARVDYDGGNQDTRAGRLTRVAPCRRQGS